MIVVSYPRASAVPDGTEGPAQAVTAKISRSHEIRAHHLDGRSQSNDGTRLRSPASRIDDE